VLPEMENSICNIFLSYSQKTLNNWLKLSPENVKVVTFHPASILGMLIAFLKMLTWSIQGSAGITADMKVTQEARLCL